MIERQVIVNWYTPEEKLPEEGEFVIVTFSGNDQDHRIKYDHTFGIAEWCNDGEGWYLYDGPPEFTIHAWSDLEPYQG